MMFACVLLLSVVASIVYASDPLSNDQWYLQGKEDVVVALIDSGIDPNHEDLQGQIIGGWDFVDNDADFTDSCYGHGTSTAGILGAVRNNNIGISGAAQHVKFLVLRVLDCNGISTEKRLVDAINYAKNNGADLIQAVIFVSHAWGIPCYDQPDCLPNLCQAIEDSGMLFVSPAGNEGIDLDDNYRYPPACEKINQISVTASDQEDELASFSSFGSTVDIMAPGVDILTTVQENGNPLWTDATGYKKVWGASYATPQVVALATELLWLQPDMDVATLKSRVLEHTTNGVLSAFYVKSEPPPPPPPTPSGLVLHIIDNNGQDLSGTENDMNCSQCPSTSMDFTYDWFYRKDLYLIGELPSHGASEYTIAANIVINSKSDRQPIVAKQGRGERGFVFLITPYNGYRIRLETWSPSVKIIDGSTVIQTGQNYHVAVTHKNDGSVTFYIDGNVDGSGSAGMPIDNNQPLEIGRYYWSGGYSRYFDGKITDFRIYDYALTDEEISDLVN